MDPTPASILCRARAAELRYPAAALHEGSGNPAVASARPARLRHVARPDENNEPAASWPLFPGFVNPAGASPVQAVTGDPGSRPLARGEIHASRAGRQALWQQREMFAQ